MTNQLWRFFHKFTFSAEQVTSRRTFSARKGGGGVRWHPKHPTCLRTCNHWKVFPYIRRRSLAVFSAIRRSWSIIWKLGLTKHWSILLITESNNFTWECNQPAMHFSIVVFKKTTWRENVSCRILIISFFMRYQNWKLQNFHIHTPSFKKRRK